MRARDVTDHDWSRIGWLASEEAQEGDHALNSDWVARRQLPAERRQSVIERNGKVEAYCAIERFDPSERFRAFLVLNWLELDEAVANSAFEQLEALIAEASAEQVWMREMAGDGKLLSFVQARGFILDRQYKFDGKEMVNLIRPAGT